MNVARADLSPERLRTAIYRRLGIDLRTAVGQVRTGLFVMGPHLSDGEGTFKSQITNIGTPQAICVSGGSTQYLYSSNSNDPESMDHGEIYKVRLTGEVVGKFGKAGKLPKEFGMVNAIDCRTENDLWVGEVWNWRAQKLTLKR